MNTTEIKSKPDSTAGQPPSGSLHSACSPFVFLDLNSEPWLVHDGWLHRWHRGAKCWVTARPLVSGETEIMAERKLKPEHAALYGQPCSENDQVEARDQ